MREFTGFEKYVIKGKGIHFAGRVPREEPLPKIGEDVKFDGKVYVVIGVEIANILTHPPKRSEQVVFVTKEK